MNKTNLFRTALLLTMVVLMNSCRREKAQSCQTCTATYNGSVISTQKLCTDEDKNNFKSQHYYAQTECH